MHRAVSFTADKETMYRANYTLRTCLSILMPVLTFKAKNAEDLYKHSKRVNWIDYFGVDSTFKVGSAVFSDNFNHTGYASLVVKDAIADSFREKIGRRPSVDTEFPDIGINIHISEDDCTLSIDTSGTPLFKRGYRKRSGIAPLNEVLAAGIISLSKWRENTEFLDPMCGSGTLAIEACMQALDMPSGLFRESFGFEKFFDFDKKMWEKVRIDCNKRIKPGLDIEFICSDSDKIMVDATKINLKETGLDKYIKVKQADFFDLQKADNPLTIFMNPPYDMRLKNKNINLFYEDIGSHLKHNFEDTKVYIFTGNLDLIKQIGLKPSSKTELYNAAIKSLLVSYELYAGTKKNKKL